MILNLLFSLLLVSGMAYAQENLADFTDKSVPVLNENLRSLNDNANKSKNLLNDYFGSGGILGTANGGTGKDFSAATADSLIYLSNTGDMDIIPPATSGWLLTSQGAGVAPTYTAPPKNSTLAFQYQAAVSSGDITNIGETENTSLTAAATPNFRYIIYKPNSTTFNTVLSGRYKKLSGVNTVTIYVELWSSAAGGDNAKVRLNIDSLNVTVTGGGAVSGPGTWVSTTLDISSLTNDTVYALSIDLAKNSTGATDRVYMGSVFVYNS